MDLMDRHDRRGEIPRRISFLESFAMNVDGKAYRRKLAEALA
jgi:hypothetical protein